MNASMATRTPRDQGKKPGEHCTEFQMHKSQQTGNSRKIIDFSEHKLRLYIKDILDEQQRVTLKGILSDYKAGKVAIAWKAGRPVWLSITRDH